MQDEAEVFARRLHAAGVTVEFDGFEGMPHCFAIIPWNRPGRVAFEGQAAFCRRAVTVGVQRTDKAFWTDKGMTRKQVRFDDLGMDREGKGHEREVELDDRTVDELMRMQREWRVKLEQEMREKWIEAGNVEGEAAM